MLFEPQGFGDAFMDNHLQWLLAGLGLCLLAGWLGYRAIKSSEARHRARRVIAEAAARAEAQRLVAEELASRQFKQRAAAQKAARADVARLAQAEAVRAQAAHRAAEDAARAAAASLAAARAARAEAARRAAEETARAAAGRIAAEAAAQSATTCVAKAPDQTVVLVADDSKVVRVKTGRLLAQHQYRVSYAIDGLDAARQLQASLPDIVITDVEMPGMDGFELTRHVRQNPRTAHIPVIMITAANDKHREDANAAGVSVLLGKPYPEEELIAHIRLAMKHAGRESGVPAVHVPGGARIELDAVA